MGFKNKGYFVVLLLIFISMFPLSLAFAQEAIPEAPDGGPSTGTVMAAALETAGYAAQAQVLSQLKEMLNRLGALIYLCVIFSALISTAIMGRYQVALWLLVGPPIYFFLIEPTETKAGVEWQLGSYNSTKNLKETLQGANVELAEGQKVSWLFHYYNVLVSDTVQQLIKIVTADKVRAQTIFMSRQQTMDDLFSAEIDSPGLRQLTALTFGLCTEEMNAARTVSWAERNPAKKNSADYATAKTIYCERMKNPDKPLPNGPAKELIRTLQTSEEKESNPALDRLSCNAYWHYMFLALMEQAKLAQERAKRDRIPVDAPDSIYEEVVRDINDKLQQANNSGDKPEPIQFQCPDGSGKFTIGPGGSDDLIPVIFAGYLMRKVALKESRGQMIGNIYDHAGVKTQPLFGHAYGSNVRELAFETQRRFRSDFMADARHYEAFTIAKLLPHVQGAGLYILGVTFPFFAMAVLLPGQAGAFFTWMALWAWLKVWDLGFAIVMVMDEVLWSLMPHSTYFRAASNGGQGVEADPVTILDSAFGGDYSYNLATYYLLVGSMITAVPLLSAHAVLGSKKAVANVFVNGLKALGQQFSTVVADWHATEAVGWVGRKREDAALHAAAPELMSAFKSVMQGKEAFAGRGLLDRGVAGGSWMMAEAKKAVSDARAGDEAMNEDRMAPRQSGDNPPDVPTNSEDSFAAGRQEQQAALAELNKLLEAGTGNRVLAMLSASVGGDKSALKAKIQNFVQNKDGVRSEMLARTTGSIGEPGVSNAEKNLGAADSRLTHPATVDYGMPTPELEAERRSIAETLDMADMQVGAGELLFVAALPFSISGDTIRNAIMGAGDETTTARKLLGNSANAAAVTMMAEGIALIRQGTELRRYVHGQSADFLGRVSEHHWYEKSKNSNEWMMWEMVRAGISGRNEWWGVPDSPHQIAKEGTHAYQDLINRRNDAQQRLWTTLGVNVVRGVTQGLQ